jgi:hypothetical protein
MSVRCEVLKMSKVSPNHVSTYVIICIGTTSSNFDQDI